MPFTWPEGPVEHSPGMSKAIPRVTIPNEYTQPEGLLEVGSPTRHQGIPKRCRRYALPPHSLIFKRLYKSVARPKTLGVRAAKWSGAAALV